MRTFALSILTFLPTLALSAEPPNVVWIISEDTGPEIGCYGDSYAVTPNIDKLAVEGLRYDFCWSNAPVCAPARTTLISGMYPTSTGAEHMRSLVPMPPGVKMFPQYLRDAGWFTANARKEDFNLEKPGPVWDADLRNNEARPWRDVPGGRPFFAVFNIQTSHESQIRARPHTPVHDPAQARIPAYHPDTPESRRDWAQYYDKVTSMDAEVGAILDRLAADGHADDTIVFYFGDHGSGMPRHKRWPFDSGLHVPLVIRIPDKLAHLRPADYQPGGSTDRLVSFVDFGPTLLSLAGVKPPAEYQGVPFLGEHAAPPREFLHGFRGRMDERIDCIRSVTDGRYVYVRHYMPHRIYGQHVGYMFQTPTTQVWKRLFDEGRLNDAQSAFWKEKPSEELFDLSTDPDEVHNLAGSPEHKTVLVRFRKEQREHALRIRDVGLVPEALLHALCGEHGVTPYELGHDASLLPLERILETADAASRRDVSADPKYVVSFTPQLVRALGDPHSAVRYWALTGLLVRKDAGFKAARDKVLSLLDDPSPTVRIAAAELAARYAGGKNADKAADVLLAAANYQNTSEYAATHALLVIDELLTARPEIVKSRAAAIESLPLTSDAKDVNPRAKEYPSRLKATILERLK